MYKDKRAYTLVEVVIVMGIIVALAFLVLPLTVNDLKNTDTRSVAVEIKSIIQLNQSNAFTKRDNKTYGIALVSNGYTLFTGSSLATSDYSENVNLGNRVSITDIDLNPAGNEIIFNAGSLRPNQTGSFVVTGFSNSYRISINKEGYVEINKI